MQHIKVGVITKLHGIRGEFRVFSMIDDKVGFTRLVGSDIFLDGLHPFKLERARTHKGMAYLKLAGINDRNLAEKFIGMGIFISKDQAVPLEADEYFERDLIGMEIITDEGNVLGYLEKIIYTPANDVYVVKPHEGKSFMIPAIKDVIKHISISEKKMTVMLMDGLDELTL